MPPRRSSGQRHRRKRTRVKVMPYVVPTTRRAPGRPMPLTVPTRWVKNIIAFFLLPWCAILTQTFFTAFTRATIHQQLWAGAEFWFFTLGALLWLIALAPYFFPLYSVLAIAVYGIASVFFNVAPYGQLLYATLGVTWAFHLTFTFWMIPKNQTDLSDHGTFFSLVFIYVMNLLLFSALLVIASPQITFASFANDLVANLRSFSEWIGGLMNQFTRGHGVPVN